MTKPLNLSVNDALHGNKGEFTVAESGRMILGDKEIAYIEDINTTQQEQVRINVTDMFTFNPSVSDAKVWMRDDGKQKPEIEIIANNSKNGTNDLIITAASGFGSWYDMVGPNAIKTIGVDIETGAAGIYDITITGETERAQTEITIPKEVNNVDFIYFLGKTDASKSSYWIDSLGTMHPFEKENTPIANFAGNWYIINGIRVEKSDIYSICIADSYLTETVLPSYFLNSIPNITAIDIYGLSNVETIGDYALSLNRQLRRFNLSYLSKATTIGRSLLAYSTGLIELICGDFDASKPGVSDVDFLGKETNIGTNIRKHTSQVLADALLAKCTDNSINRWTVIIEP